MAIYSPEVTIRSLTRWGRPGSALQLPAARPAQIARLQPQTRLLIDGVPNSANSYARAAFLQANGSPEMVCSHSHSHRVLVRAVRRRLPVIMLLRRPDAVVESGRLAGVGATRVLTDYLRYYRQALPVLHKVVVGRYDMVLEDFGDVIMACNRRFGTEFVPYDPSPAAENDVLYQLAQASESWAALARAPHATPLTPPERRLLDQARALYQEVLDWSH